MPIFHLVDGEMVLKVCPACGEPAPEHVEGCKKAKPWSVVPETPPEVCDSCGEEIEEGFAVYCQDDIDGVTIRTVYCEGCWSP
ncbi:MAG TPA: hypothetical protein VMU09_11115 [Acidimicrobiales bacterium]|nr:hypothetical protein [Acidimicrobiales bacterium]